MEQFEASSADADTSWLSAVKATILERWWVVMALAAAALVIAMLYLRTASYDYTATLRVAAAPSTQRPAGGLGALGGLASLAGIAGPNSEPATPFRLYLEGVYSREVADRLARDPVIMHRIFAREWDAAAKQWRQPTSLLRTMKNGVFALIGIPTNEWRPPDGARLQDYLGDAVAVRESVKSPIVAITYDNPDPAFGVHVLTALHEATDGYLREQSFARTRDNIAYLTAKASVTDQAEYRQVLFASLSQQEQQMMLVNSRQPYAAQPFGAVTASTGPTRPRPVLLLLGALISGVILGTALALFLGRRRRDDVLVPGAA
jgi:hypothetical protein